jgi:hypothetical protein
MGKPLNTLDRIFANATRDDSGCLLFHGSRNHHGYPTVSYRGKTYRAHRLVYQLLHGPIAGKDVHHVCHTRHCIEPTHLVATTHRHNVLESAHYVRLRNHRLSTLLDYCPTVEWLPVAIPSTTLQHLWGCRSDNVPGVLESMRLAYPAAQFAWQRLRPGTGRTPALFALHVQSALVQHVRSQQNKDGSTPLVVARVA